MPLIRKFAVQGHDVPHGYTPARGPFPAEILMGNQRAEQDYGHADSLHEALDDVRIFKCKFCGEILYEEEIELHECK